MIIEPRRRDVGSITVQRLLPWRKLRMVGPFVFLDVMGPATFPSGEGLDVDAHPHIGLSTLTYLLEGRLMHRDSLGITQVIGAGEVNWMTAGSGVCHTERTLPEDRAAGSRLFGVQTWIALPDGAEDDPPSFEHADASGTPMVEDASVSIRVLAGTGWGQAAAVRGSSPLVLADVETRGSVAPLEVDHGELAVLAITGQVEVAGQPLPPGRLQVLGGSEPRTIGGTGRALVLGGQPLGRRHIWWNFVHSDPSRIEDAKERWRRQEFPQVPGDHDPFVELPSA
jgi:redox-sensitive bicupin YhaK (pirin superfamily)